MKKVLTLLLAMALATSLVSCNRDKPIEQSDTNTNQSAASEGNVPTEQDEANLDLIIVSMEVDAVLSQAIVTVKNDSPLSFTGDIYATFKNAQGSFVGSDLIFVEGLPPGNSTYARIAISEIESITMEHRFENGYKFEENVNTIDATLDAALTDSLFKEFSSSFGGGGNPEYATSWFKHLVKLEVYALDDGNMATMVVKDDADEAAIQSLGNALFANFKNAFDLKKVNVVNESGETVFNKEA
jgi:predicted small lipoprotein YifL